MENIINYLDDFSRNTNTTGQLNINSSVTGTIEIPRDTDWFHVVLSAGTSYQIDLEASPTAKGTLSDPYLRGIYDSNGFPIRGTINDVAVLASIHD